MIVKISKPPEYVSIHINDILTSNGKRYRVVDVKLPYQVRTERTIKHRNSLTRQEEEYTITEWFRYCDINKDLSIKVDPRQRESRGKKYE